MNADEKDDLDMVNLLKEMDDMARSLVEKVGGYPTFGGLIDNHGKVQLIFDQTAITGGGDAQTINAITDMVRREAKPANIRAAAVANMGFMNDPGTGRRTTVMVISLHHRTGRCIDYVTPFSKAASGAIRFGEPTAGLGKTMLF